MNNKQRKWLLVSAAAAALILTYTQVTLFVVPPIGALPEGQTFVVVRSDTTKFIDSPEALCERTQGNVSLLCRAGATVSVVTTRSLLWRWPYSSWLYSLSTGGKHYDF